MARSRRVIASSHFLAMSARAMSITASGFTPLFSMSYATAREGAAAL